jgi:hypothetical protein
MHIVFGGRDLAQAGHAAREPVDIGHGEVDAAFLRGGQQVQDRVGRSAHRDVHAHGVLKGAEAGDAARQGGGVVLLVPAFGEIDDDMARFAKQFFAIRMCGQGRAIAGQRQAQRFGQAVH